MGPKQFHTHFACRGKHENCGGKPQNHLNEIDDGYIGMDASCFLYRVTKSQSASSVADVDPKVPLYHALKLFTNQLSFLIDKHKLSLLLCFDGRGHPMKKDTQESRRETRQNHRNQLLALYSSGVVDDEVIQKVISHRKSMA